MSVSPEANNYEIFLWSLYQLGGATRFVDIEEIFLKCFELAPLRFAWRTRSDLPNYKKCYKALLDAEARRPPLFVKTGDSFLRQLTKEGQEWFQSNAQRMETLLKAGRVIQEPQRRPRARLMAGVERSGIYEAWRSTGELPKEKWRVAELLWCSPDSDHKIWAQRLEVLRGAAFAAGKKEVLGFLDKMREIYPEWFDGSLA